MSPFSDLSAVAAAGRRARSDAASLMGISAPSAAYALYDHMKGAIAQGGEFDYQRRAYKFGKDGFTQLRQFRNVSNFNVGLFCQQAGLSLEDTFSLAGKYASRYSSNAKPGNPNDLDSQTQQFIELGFKAGASGAYDSPDRK